MSMSGMADEMARRMEADGGASLPNGDPGAGAAPGTEGSQPTPAPPAAEPSRTDTGTGGGTPDSIPYSRFKEVNDRYQELRGFEQLTQYGYDPDSLGRLAAFESQYLTDPLGTWKAMADNLDLPQELKAALETHLSSTPQPGPAEGEPSANGQTPPQQDDETQRALEWVKSQQRLEVERADQERLDSTISHWDKLDTQDGIETPERVKLMAISATASSGRVFRTVEELAEAARETIVEYRGSVLGGAVRTGRSGSPLSVPGGAPAPAAPVTFGGDIRAASRAAEEAIKRGELPSIRVGE